MTIRSVLNFVYAVAENLIAGLAKITLSIKIVKKINWISEEKV